MRWCWLILLGGLLSSGCEGTATIPLRPTRPAAPPAALRWRDIADRPYSPAFRRGFDYAGADVEVTHTTAGPVPAGTLRATGLKPNFAYQLVLEGVPGTKANERLGFKGRWWQQQWDGKRFSGGGNLNHKGAGESFSPNDAVYLQRRDLPDKTSPGGRRYRYRGYLFFGYFVTDARGSAEVKFRLDSSWHVLWKTAQRKPRRDDGEVATVRLAAAPAGGAYGEPQPAATVAIYPEWERLPANGLRLTPGQYTCRLALIEESFHGSGGASGGAWAHAMEADIAFGIRAPPACLCGK